MSAGLAALAGLCVALAPWWPALRAGRPASDSGVVGLNRRLFSLFVRRRGSCVRGGVRAIHVLYYLYSAASYALVWVAWQRFLEARGDQPVPGRSSCEQAQARDARFVVIGAGPAGLTAA